MRPANKPQPRDVAHPSPPEPTRGLPPLATEAALKFGWIAVDGSTVSATGKHALGHTGKTCKAPRHPLWLTHHAELHHERCALVGKHLVCRRCLVSYPIALLAMAAGLAGLHWPSTLDPVLLWVLPAPAILDFVAEHLVRSPYSAKRQSILSAIAAVAYGRGLSRYLVEPGDSLFWHVAIVYSLVMATSAIGRLTFDHYAKQHKEQTESDAWWAELQAGLETGVDGQPGREQPISRD